MNPDTYKPIFLAFQSTILVYYLATLVLLIVHGCILQPQIRNSKRDLFKEKLKYLLIWFPIALALIGLQIFNVIMAQGMWEHHSRWVYRLESVEDFYTCTDDALWIDLDYFRKEYIDDTKVIYLVLIAGNFALICSTLCQFLGHFAMMMRWYRENPIDGKEIARSIQVGIPPDQDCPAKADDEKEDEMHLGFTVPEADREVFRTPTKRLKDISVAAMPPEGESHQV